jgi:hypothetical protein
MYLHDDSDQQKNLDWLQLAWNIYSGASIYYWLRPHQFNELGSGAS